MQVSFLRRQVAIARTHCQAIGFTHRWQAFDTDVHIQIAYHLADQHQLLEILLPKHCHIRLHQIEQLAHHGGNAGEMTGAGSAFQQGADTGNLNFSCQATVGVHDGWGWGKHHIHAASLQAGTISVQCTRISSEVFLTLKLGGVDENGYHHLAAQCLRPFDQGQMPSM